MAFDVHVVSHTHWDREWYHPVERFRQRLVALVDELLDDPPSRGESFLLDGQAIIIDDYLAVRPERRDEVRALLADGRLEAGPWYVLADELIPSGEALVRNLLAGQRTMRRVGSSPPPVLYCPDSFGHPAALPAIAAGFGLPVIILWRGYGGSRWPAGDTARWLAPSGDAALLFHLSRDGYEFGSHLPSDPIAAVERWTRMRRELEPRSSTGALLVLNGADHHARQRDLRVALNNLERAAANDRVHRSSMHRFAEQLVERAEFHELPVIEGELRDSYGYTWTLQGTFATRAHEKRANALAERLLLREAEPWSALASRTGKSRRPLVETAWRTLLEAHPHDTLCGCSIDDVADAMELRLRSATNQAEGLRDDSVADLIGHDAVAAREARDRWQPIVVVRNAAPRARSGVAMIDIEQFIADVPVGPGSAPTMPPPSPPAHTPTVSDLGKLQVVSRLIEHSRTESPRHYPDNDLVVRTRALAWVSDVPPYGIASYSIGASKARRRASTHVVHTTANSIQNEFLRVSVSGEGRVSLENLESGRVIESLIDLVDDADVGDLYTPAPRERPFRVQLGGVRCVLRGPLRGELALRLRVLDTTETRKRPGVDLTIHLSLDAGAPFLRVHVAGDNRRENHRLRFVIRSDVPSDSVWADAAFGVVKRYPLSISPEEAAVEQAPATAPLHRYISRFDDSRGCTLFSDGLAEYEARSDGSIAVTLLRSVGELSRNDLPERPGHAGWPAPTPKAQCLGAFEGRFAFMFHGTRSVATVDAIERVADDVLCPLVGTTLRSALHVPAPIVGVELAGVGLAFSAVKESENGEWLMLRCVNLTEQDVDGRWNVPFEIVEARVARLDEAIIGELSATGRSVAFNARPREIVTILVSS